MKTLAEALNAYREHFKENFPLCIAGENTDTEIIEQIERCIAKNEKAELPEYDEDADY